MGLGFGGVGLGGGEGGELPLVAALGAAADDLDRLQGLVVARLDLGALDLRELVCVHSATISKLDRKYSVTIHNRKNLLLT